MRSIFQIAKYTFHEALRRRFMNVLLLFGVGLIAVLPLLAKWSPGAELNMLTDWGLFFIRFFAILMAVLLGATLIPTEIDKKTIHVLLAKPVNRVHILFGKLLGVFATVATNIIVMGIVFMVVMLAKRSAFEGQTALNFLYSNLATALVLMLFEILVLTALTIAVSTVSSWLFTAVFALSVYGAGQITASLGRLATPENYPQLPVRLLLKVVQVVIPHFEDFDIRLPIMQGVEFQWWPLGIKIIGYALLYTAVVLGLGYLFFNEREV